MRKIAVSKIGLKWAKGCCFASFERKMILLKVMVIRRFKVIISILNLLNFQFYQSFFFKYCCLYTKKYIFAKITINKVSNTL